MRPFLLSALASAAKCGHLRLGKLPFLQPRRLDLQGLSQSAKSLIVAAGGLEGLDLLGMLYIAQSCDFETILQTQYTSDCMVKRNKYMVDNSSVLISVFDGSFGGTMHTVNYAKKQGLEIIELKP